MSIMSELNDSTLQKTTWLVEIQASALALLMKSGIENFKMFIRIHIRR